MLKVLIADDEKRVCRLIQMLCDWNLLGMELIGTASNGIQALEMIEQYQPDIFITDICMPGYSGIEIIEKAKEKGLEFEVLIISGYADFQYAQTAIRLGVSEYLLKPIKQKELQETLKKLGSRCRQKREERADSDQLLRYIEDSHTRKRCSFFLECLLSDIREEIPDMEQMNQEYLFHFQEGCYQIIIIKVDYDTKQYDNHAVKAILIDMEEKIADALNEYCFDMEFYTEGDKCYILCNYSEENKNKIRIRLKHVTEKLYVQRFRMSEIYLSICIGQEVIDCRKIRDTLNNAVEASKERYIEGCYKLLECPVKIEDADYSELIEKMNQQCAVAFELLDEQILREASDELQNELLKKEHITGSDLYNVVTSVGLSVITKRVHQNNDEKVAAFLKECNVCCSVEKLFERLTEQMVLELEEKKKLEEEEVRRPVRLAQKYMMNHYMETLTLEVVADQVGFSSSYFSSVFKKELGIGFADYLIQLRMEKAKELLRNTKMNVKDVCREIGYSDLKHFTSLFRKFTGLKPGEYRKLYG